MGGEIRERKGGEAWKKKKLLCAFPSREESLGRRGMAKANGRGRRPRPKRDAEAQWLRPTRNDRGRWPRPKREEVRSWGCSRWSRESEATTRRSKERRPERGEAGGWSGGRSGASRGRSGAEAGPHEADAGSWSRNPRGRSGIEAGPEQGVPRPKRSRGGTSRGRHWIPKKSEGRRVPSRGCRGGSGGVRRRPEPWLSSEVKLWSWRRPKELSDARGVRSHDEALWKLEWGHPRRSRDGGFTRSRSGGPHGIDREAGSRSRLRGAGNLRGSPEAGRRPKRGAGSRREGPEEFSAAPLQRKVVMIASSLSLATIMRKGEIR